MSKTLKLTFFTKIYTGITGKIRMYVYCSPEATLVSLNVLKMTGCPVMTYTCYTCQVRHILTLIVSSRKGNVFKVLFLPRDTFTVRTLGCHDVCHAPKYRDRQSYRAAVMFPLPPHAPLLMQTG